MPASDTCTPGNSAHVWPQRIKVLSTYQWRFARPHKVNYSRVVCGVKKSKNWCVCVVFAFMFNKLACVGINVRMCLSVRGKLLVIETREVVQISLKSRKNFRPIRPQFSYLHHPFIISQSGYSSRLIHNLTITLPLTLKPNMTSTLTFPTLTHFLGELELYFHAHSLRKLLLSLAANILVLYFSSLTFAGVCFSVELWSPWAVHTSRSMQVCLAPQ